MERIIGRENELARLADIAASDKPEFVAVYGWNGVVAKKTMTMDDLFEVKD